jgi:hypothetical protein
MDTEYAKLTFAVGWFAGSVDQYLGRAYFTRLTRRYPRLTVELLNEWRRDARDLGVPDNIVEAAPPDVALATALLLVKDQDQRR